MREEPFAGNVCNRRFPVAKLVQASVVSIQLFGVGGAQRRGWSADVRLIQRGILFGSRLLVRAKPQPLQCRSDKCVALQMSIGRRGPCGEECAVMRSQWLAALE